MTMGADALAKIEDVRALVAAHREAVYGAQTMEEVTAEESGHAAARASMMGCTMNDMVSVSMSDADAPMGGMMGDVDAYEAAHAGHAPPVRRAPPGAALRPAPPR